MAIHIARDFLLELPNKRLFFIFTNNADPDEMQLIDYTFTYEKVFRINPEFRIWRLTFHRMSASKSLIRHIIITISLITF